MPIMQAVTPRQDSLPADGTRTGRLAAWKDRGATMVEFAIVSVFLFALIFIIIEGAFAVRARSTMSNAIDDAARRGAVAASATNADYQIMNQLFGRGANSVAEVEYVSVFRATNGSADVPANCAAGVAVPNVCNVYPASILFDGNGAFNANEALFGCASYGTQWCATSRGNDPNILEFVGVYVKADYRFILQGVFTDQYTVNVSGASLQAIETSGEAVTTP